MVLFETEITAIYSLNFFSPAEKLTYKRDIGLLYEFLNSTAISHRIIDISTAPDLFNILSEIESNPHQGILLNFIGHGNRDLIGNNIGLSILWSTIIPYLQKINSNDDLIVNTAMMCNGDGIFSFINEMPKPFHAAFGTNTKTNAEVFFRTIQILKKCLKADNILPAIEHCNSELMENKEEYEEANKRFKEEAERLGEPFTASVITQFSHVV